MDSGTSLREHVKYRRGHRESQLVINESDAPPPRPNQAGPQNSASSAVQRLVYCLTQAKKV